eukprot:TRINITY_DN4967_c0_g1_i1.p1 TRINITY_DN4967_c0_g1~~TRINITY_DN4967_c0_g1_i1.p1  ORF type:complete len:533 (-),score=142.23 TRINITY_DN4967_c0_g1_i1:177-1775(-)
MLSMLPSVYQSLKPIDLFQNLKVKYLIVIRLLLLKLLSQRLHGLLQYLEINAHWSENIKESGQTIMFRVSTGTEEILRHIQSLGIGDSKGNSGSVDVVDVAVSLPESETNRFISKPESQVFDRDKITFAETIKSRLIVDQLVQEVDNGSVFSFDYLLLIIVASILAGLGLLADNTVIIVASMLVSPLMGPILAITFGLTLHQIPMLRRGLFSEILGLVMCWIVGMLLGVGAVWWTDDWNLPNSEMESRGQWAGLLYGLGIALPSGIGVALSIVGNNTGSLVGVAISASLLPPAVNSGIFFAMGAVIKLTSLNPDDVDSDLFRYSLISFLLTLLNIACIIITAYGMFRLKEIAPIPGKTELFGKHVPLARKYYDTVKKADATKMSRLARLVVERNLDKAHPQASTARTLTLGFASIRHQKSLAHQRRPLHELFESPEGSFYDEKNSTKTIEEEDSERQRTPSLSHTPPSKNDAHIDKNNEKTFVVPSSPANAGKVPSLKPVAFTHNRHNSCDASISSSSNKDNTSSVSVMNQV